MNADLLVTGISQFATPLGAAARRGREMNELSVVEDAVLAISEGRFVWIGGLADWDGRAKKTIDIGGHAVVPGLIDPHTHAVWAGDRLADFDARASGSTYSEILAAGGGIRSTIRATAAASSVELVALTVPRINALIASGATVIEVKSGYGFTSEAEVASLLAIQELSSKVRARIVPTLLIHIPPEDLAEREGYLDRVVDKLIPDVARQGLAAAIDIFVEQDAFHVEEAERVLQCARESGLRIKMHADQFHSIGGVALAVQLGALSVDHLEASGVDVCRRLATSNTVATILPGVSLHLGTPAAPGRQLIDSGAIVAIGTDLNPGSSPLYSIATALALAVRLNGLTAKEALIAGTVNAACALGLNDAGRIEPGLRADFLVLEDRDWRSLVYTLGANPVREVWVGGEKIFGANP